MTRKEQNIEYKPILDACCGGKMFYFDKDNPNVLFQDIRDVDMTLCDGRSFSIHPDIVADFRDMPPYGPQCRSASLRSHVLIK